VAFFNHITASLALLLALCACSDAQTRPEGTDKMTKTSQIKDADAHGRDVAAKISLALPAATKFEFADYMQGHDDNARLIVTLSANDWAALSAKPPFSGAAYAPENMFHMAPDDGAWAPSKEKNMGVAQVPYHGGTQSLNIGLKPLDDGSVRLYLFWYQL
jgi:hypothetical protein